MLSKAFLISNEIKIFLFDLFLLVYKIAFSAIARFCYVEQPDLKAA